MDAIDCETRPTGDGAGRFRRGSAFGDVKDRMCRNFVCDYTTWQPSPGMTFASIPFPPTPVSTSLAPTPVAGPGRWLPDERPAPDPVVPQWRPARGDRGPGEIGRASCRERVCQYV